jgi:hypothetical protein
MRCRSQQIPVPYKKIALHLQKTDLACRLHYHRIAKSKPESVATSKSDSDQIGLDEQHLSRQCAFDMYANDLPRHQRQIPGVPLSSQFINMEGWVSWQDMAWTSDEPKTFLASQTIPVEDDFALPSVHPGSLDSGEEDRSMEVKKCSIDAILNPNVGAGNE